jgi:hypothetical protein
MMKTRLSLLLVASFLVLLPLARAGLHDSPPLAPIPSDVTKQGRVEFRMEGKKFDEVFDWLANQTWKPVVTSFAVPGSLTFVGPKGARYTLPEILAIINRALGDQGLLLVEREKCFNIVGFKEELVVLPSSQQAALMELPPRDTELLPAN